MSNGNTDPLVVRTEDLASVIEKWAAEHLAYHPATKHKGWETHQAMNHNSGLYEKQAHRVMPETGPYQYIVERSWGQINERAISRIVRLETKTTSLKNADTILSAIGLGYKLHNGEVPVIPNPRMSLETYMRYIEEELGQCI